MGAQSAISLAQHAQACRRVEDAEMHRLVRLIDQEVTIDRLLGITTGGYTLWLAACFVVEGDPATTYSSALYTLSELFGQWVCAGWLFFVGLTILTALHQSRVWPRLTGSCLAIFSWLSMLAAVVPASGVLTPVAGTYLVCFAGSCYAQFRTIRQILENSK